MSHILFNVLLCDLFPRAFVSGDSDVAALADEIRVASYEATVQIAPAKLSNDLDNVRTFARKRRLEFDIVSDKCGAMVFSSRRQGSRCEQVYFSERPSSSKLQNTRRTLELS